MLAVQRYYFFALAVFLVLFLFSVFHFSEHVSPIREAIARVPYRASKHTLRDTITHLFEPIKHEITNPRYREPNGKWYSVNETIWKKPLGHRILIVDIDTRVPSGENQILNPTLLDYEHLKPEGGGMVSNAMINHYMYAMVHGYDYKYYQAQHIADHYDTWILPHVFRELIPQYDFVVALDADAIVSHLEVPLEWMFNRWGIQKHTSMALPYDTEEMHVNISISRDSRYNRVLNTGFVVAQNSPLTIELLEAWRDCTTEKRYPGCGEWKDKWSHEQRAFSEYIRYDFNNTPETIVSIPCDDAVGYPGFKEINKDYNEGLSDCNGNFVRHYTVKKHKVKKAGAFSIMQLLADVMQKSLLQPENGIWYKEPEHAAFAQDFAPTTPAEKHEAASVPDNINQSEIEELQREIRKVAQEKARLKEKPTEQEEATPVLLDGMIPKEKNII